MAIDTEEFRVIDADTHMTEKHDLWTSRAPAKYKDRVPHVEVDKDGMPQWVIEGKNLGRAAGGGVIGRDGNKVNAERGLFEFTIDDIHEGAYDTDVRLKMMDDSGVWAEILYPNNIGVGGQYISAAVPDQELRVALVQIYNDAMAEIQADSGDRLLPMGVLPSWDIGECVKEAERIASLGTRGVNMTSEPEEQGVPDLGSPAWDPLWEACSDLQLPVHFHIGAGLNTRDAFGKYPWASQKRDTALAIGGVLLFVGNARVLVNVITSGMLDRHPNLKIVSVESGCGWIPFVLEGLEFEMSENAPKDLAELPLTPLEYFRRNMFATTWFEKSNLPSVVEAVGEDNIMFESDFPHPASVFPDPVTVAKENMKGLSEEVQRKILGDTARKLYRL